MSCLNIKITSLCRAIRLRSASAGSISLVFETAGLHETIFSTQRETTNRSVSSYLRVVRQVDLSSVTRSKTWIQTCNNFCCSPFFSPVHKTGRGGVMTRSKSPLRCTVASWGIPGMWRTAMKRRRPASPRGRGVPGWLPTQHQPQRPEREWWRLRPDLGARSAVTCRVKELLRNANSRGHVVVNHF